MEDEGIEEGEIADSESDNEELSREEFNKIPWPPGCWRLGDPFMKKAHLMFMRFATKGSV